MKLLYPVLLVILFASCKNTWTTEDKDAFYQACTEDAGRATTDTSKIKPYCDCVLQKVMEKYPHVSDALEHLDKISQDSSVQTCRSGLLK